MSSSQSGPEVASPPPVRNKMKILYSDWVLDDQDTTTDTCDIEDSKNKGDMLAVPSDKADKPKKRGRPRITKEAKNVKKPKKSAGGAKTKTMVPSDLAEVKPSSVPDVGCEGNEINLEEWLTDEEEVEHKVDMNENENLSHPHTVASSREAKKADMSSLKNLSSTSQGDSSPVSDPAPGLSPSKVSLTLPTPPLPARPGPRMLKPLSAGVGRRISARPDIQEVKSEHKMYENKVLPETLASAKIMTPSYDLTNTSTEQDGSFSSISPPHPPSPPLPDQAPSIGSAKQLSQAALSVPGPGSSPGHKLVWPVQPRLPRPPRPGPGVGRGRARPTGPRPAGSRGGMVFPGPRLSNPRSLAAMRRSSSHPQSQYFPVTSHPVYSPQLEQFHSPSPCSSPILSNQDVSIVREVSPSPPIRQGWVPPPGLTMERVPATEPTQTISTLASILHQLGQVEGRRRLVKYKLTEEQIRALRTLGVGQEGGGGWQ